jgi:hypothetical protein
MRIQHRLEITRLQHENGLCYYASRLCIPDDMHIRTFLLKEAHEPAYSGHQGTARTLANLSRIAWWPKLLSDVMSFVRASHSYQVNKPANLAPAGLLQPLPVPEQYWDSLDFMVRLPRTQQGEDTIAVFVDRLSKYVRIIPTKTDITAIKFATVFQDTIFRHYGIPKSLVSEIPSLHLNFGRAFSKHSVLR